MLINTFHKGDGSPMRAEIHKEDQKYMVSFYGPSGEKLKQEIFENKSLYYVEDAATNWLHGIKILNG